MASIVKVVVIDLTRPVEQKGFKSVALIDCTAVKETSVITDSKGLTGDLAKCASAYFGNGGQYLIIAGADMKGTADGNELTTLLEKVMKTNTFYGLTLIMPADKQKVLLAKAKEFCEGNELLCVTEVNGTKAEVTTATENLNSDRVAVFATSSKTATGLGSAVCGMGFPQNEGSITWANKVLTGVELSKYTLSDELALQESKINYFTEELGYNITQFGRTLSGSNIDITRSKDWLKNRIKEGLTYALVNAKKIPFTTRGLARISGALDQVGQQAIEQGMLEEFRVHIPNVDSIPVADKANRILRNVVVTAKLTGAIETVEVELQIVL